MAQGREYSAYQQRIIKRYFLHRDSIAFTRLSEMVGELYLLDPADTKKLDAKWSRVAIELAKVRTEPPLPKPRVDKILAERNVEHLAQLIAEMAAQG